MAVLAFAPRIPAGVVRAFDAAVWRVAGSRWKLPLLVVATVPVLWGMKAWLIDTPDGWLPEGAVYLYYLGFFLAGATLYRHRDLLPTVGRRWAVLLGVANVLVLPLMLWMTITGNWWQRELSGDVPWAFVGWKAAAITLAAAYTWLSLAGLIGLFQRHFATQAGWWKYLVGASYWCYLAGFPVQAAVQVWFARVGLPSVTEFLLVNALTFLAVLASYELCVRRTWIGRVLNGSRGAPAARPQGGTVVSVRVGRPGTLPPKVPAAGGRSAFRLDRGGQAPKTTGTGA